MPCGDAEFIAHVVKFAAEKARSLPKFKPNGELREPLDIEKHSNFIYPLPNPTTQGFASIDKGLKSINPVDFHGLNSSVIIWDPQVFLNHCSIRICCPCVALRRTGSRGLIASGASVLYRVRYTCMESAFSAEAVLVSTEWC
jgi:hypothetical protein